MKRFAASLVFLTLARGAELKQETIRAWEEYVQAANAQMRERIGPSTFFSGQTRFLGGPDNCGRVRLSRNRRMARVLVLSAPG